MGDYIGTDVSGKTSVGNGYGVILKGGSNTIGGVGQVTDGTLTLTAGNIISGNTSAGIENLTPFNNLVIGNYIGTDVSGTKSLGNAIGIG